MQLTEAVNPRETINSSTLAVTHYKVLLHLQSHTITLDLKEVIATYLTFKPPPPKVNQIRNKM